MFAYIDQMSPGKFETIMVLIIVGALFAEKLFNRWANGGKR